MRKAAIAPKPIGAVPRPPTWTRVAGLALPFAVWVLCMSVPRPGGTDRTFLVLFPALLAGLAVVDQAAPGEDAPPWRRLLWLGAELALAFLVVHVHGTLVRPALIYLLPASRAILLFGERWGLPASLSALAVYALNVAADVLPDRAHEFRNYVLLLLPSYIVAVLLTHAAVRQAADRRRVQGLYDKLRSAHDELQALHRQAREAAATEERNRLAREIHDSLAHYLTVINVQLEAAEKLGEEQPERAREQVRRARRLTLDCLQEVRRSVAALRTARREDLALAHALRKLVEDFGENTSIRVQLTLGIQDDAQFPPDVSLALYRAAQEGLTNVHRHARASAVSLALTRTDGALELTVEDNGMGPPDDGEVGNGFGLTGLKERVELLGGQMAFSAAQSGGARLIVTVPLEPLQTGIGLS
jgi:signal transduction histidine kinase